MTTQEKEELKTLIREIIREDKYFIKDILRELVEEQPESTSQSEPGLERNEKIDAIICRDFERYKNVFKALA